MACLYLVLIMTVSLSENYWCTSIRTMQHICLRHSLMFVYTGRRRNKDLLLLLLLLYIYKYYNDSYTIIQPRVFINFFIQYDDYDTIFLRKNKKIIDTYFLFSSQGWVARRVINMTTAIAGSLSVTFTWLNASPRKQIMPAENHPCTLTKRYSTYWRVQCLSLLNFLSK